MDSIPQVQANGSRYVNENAHLKRFFKIPEAVDYNGHSRSALYEAQKRDELIFTKFGGASRIEKIDLDAYLDRTAVKVEAA